MRAFGCAPHDLATEPLFSASEESRAGKKEVRLFSVARLLCPRLVNRSSDPGQVPRNPNQMILGRQLTRALLLTLVCSLVNFYRFLYAIIDSLVLLSTVVRSYQLSYPLIDSYALISTLVRSCRLSWVHIDSSRRSQSNKANLKINRIQLNPVGSIGWRLVR